MAERYLKQVIVVRKDLSMPMGKLAAMVGHAAMTFLAINLRERLLPEIVIRQEGQQYAIGGDYGLDLPYEQARWLTELDPGLEAHGQISFAKIVCQVANEAELRAVEQQAKEAGLTVHGVVDSGHSHNKPGDFVCIAIGPHWPEKLDPVTKGLKLYR